MKPTVNFFQVPRKEKKLEDSFQKIYVKYRGHGAQYGVGRILGVADVNSWGCNIYNVLFSKNGVVDKVHENWICSIETAIAHYTDKKILRQYVKIVSEGRR